MFGRRRSREAFQVEVFDRDPTKAVNEIAGNFMKVIPAPIAEAGMIFGERSFSHRSGLGTTLAAGNSAVPTAQFAFSALRPAGGSNSTSLSPFPHWNLSRATITASTAPMNYFVLILYQKIVPLGKCHQRASHDGNCFR